MGALANSPRTGAVFGEGDSDDRVLVVAGAAGGGRRLWWVRICHRGTGWVRPDFVQHDEARRITGTERRGSATRRLFSRGKERFHQGIYQARFGDGAAGNRSVLVGARQQPVLLRRHVEDQILRPDSREDEGRSSARF